MATKQRKGIGTDTSATVAHGEDSAGKPRAHLVGDDGDIHPFMGPGENGLSGSSRRAWVQVPGAYGTRLTNSGTLFASPCRLIGLLVTTTTVATAAGAIKDGGSGGMEKWSPFFNALGTVFLPCGGATHGTDVYFTKGTDWAGSIQAVVDAAV
ncbi:hypothetical protein [Zavarzinia sp.]|jgi:hypothetical protein|uniref:hypothetical protein n=1 Tax=Zavarzinia sp. TaxID=2027920 RepID=UPI0035689DD1